MMRRSHRLLGIAVLVASCMTTGVANAASDCLQLELSASTPTCIGQLASISASITNSCPSRERVSAQFTLDGQQLPVTSRFSIAGGSTLARSFTVPIPSTAKAGSHSLTVTLTDASGGTTSATIDLTFESCAAR